MTTEELLDLRQAAILTKVALGFTYEEAGKEHGIGRKQVLQVVAAAKKRLGARSLPHAIGLAILSGEVDLTGGPLDSPHQPDWVRGRRA
ncbi:hypothetical protein ABZY44_23980 [Streptomyces sp. NPDC006544]|uniref:hypothetical protein n=1 Tax=Streptomyces sp. NPDC006544 TaxID=3154583 RepID=UPI0033AA0F2D